VLLVKILTAQDVGRISPKSILGSGEINGVPDIQIWLKGSFVEKLTLRL
jgi:hypothetical protein